jgi:itaconate CoA-transferase
MLTSEQVLARLEVADIPFGRLNQATDLIVHPQLLERGRIRDVETPAGVVPAFLPPFNLNGIEPNMGPVPALGQHTNEVLTELGRTTDQIQQLITAQIVRAAGP